MNAQLSSLNCMGYNIFTGNLDLFPIQQKTLINTINQYSYCIAEEDSSFKESLQKCDILLPDGIGIVAASKLLNGKIINKIAGADLHQYLLSQLEKKGGSCFYLGSSESTLAKIRERLNKEFPSVKVETYSPPFATEFSEEANAEMLNAVNAYKPDVLFVGMTAPKQEKWTLVNKEYLDAKIICSIGAVFDFYAGTVERPSAVWINLGLEWMGRLIKEPRRMWKRYIYYGFVFGYYLLKEKLKPNLFLKNMMKFGHPQQAEGWS